MDKDSRIFVAGHSGLVGSALVRRLEDYSNVITAPHADLDLTQLGDTIDFFQATKPEYVFLAAARVGGIKENDSFPVGFLDTNIRIQLNVMQAAHETGVEKLLFLGSSCIYPRMADQPMTEDCLLTGALEETNDAYAIAKISGIVGCRSYNRQHNHNFVAAMPTNLYGPNDNFDLSSSHVLPAIIRKMHIAKMSNSPNVDLWGSGSPKREFMYVDDMADACVVIMKNYTPKTTALSDVIVNVGTGIDISIRNLAGLIASVVGYSGEITWDTTMPDGTPRKLLDISRLRALGWDSNESLRSGIKKTYSWFLKEGPK